MATLDLTIYFDEIMPGLGELSLEHNCWITKIVTIMIQENTIYIKIVIINIISSGKFQIL